MRVQPLHFLTLSHSGQCDVQVPTSLSIISSTDFGESSCTLPSASFTRSGINPWHLDANTESVLFLTNMGDKDAAIGFRIQAAGIRYYIIDLKLKPLETRAVDIRKLRDQGASDFQGHRIPAAASDGAVFWSAIGSAPVVGRLLILERSRGITSNFDCACSCGSSFTSVDTGPVTFDIIPNITAQCTARAVYRDCNGNPTYFDITSLARWGSTNVAIATVNPSGLVTGVAGGTSSIWAEYTGSVSTYNYLTDMCDDSLMTTSGSSTCNVCDFTIAPTAVNAQCTGALESVNFTATVQPSLTACNWVATAVGGGSTCISDFIKALRFTPLCRPTE